MSNSRVLYVAEPIDQSDFGEWKESVDRMIGIAVKRGWLVYRPSTAWRVEKSTPVGPEIEETNRMVIARSGAMLAHVPDGVPSIGVPREVEWAVANSMPVLAVTDRRGWSLADVDVVDVGDAAGFGIWLKAAEEYVGPIGSPVIFMLDGGRLPTRVNVGDAGYDLYVSEDTMIPAGTFVDVPCGVHAAFPPGVFGRITGRSSTRRKRGLLVIEGVIDTGYRGPLYAGVQNLTGTDVLIVAGDRIAQLLLHENVAQRHYAVEAEPGYFHRIPGDGRGESGFGSSGD